MTENAKEPMANIAPFGLRMQADLKEAIKISAERNNRSMNAEIVACLEGLFQMRLGNRANGSEPWFHGKENPMNAHTPITPADGSPAGPPRRSLDIEALIYDLMRATVALDDLVDLKFNEACRRHDNGMSYQFGEDTRSGLEFLTNTVREKAYQLHHEFADQIERNGFVS